MSYRYRAAERFWRGFYRLGSAQKESVRKAWKIFQEDPFDPRLRTHKIHRLSAHYGRTCLRRGDRRRSARNILC